MELRTNGKSASKSQFSTFCYRGSLSDPRVKSLGLEKSPTSLRGPLAQLWSDANDNAEKLSLRGHAYDILNISIYCLSIMKHVMLM